jgi:F-type H+-transporting ATPase subunit c
MARIDKKRRATPPQGTTDERVRQMKKLHSWLALTMIVAGFALMGVDRAWAQEKGAKAGETAQTQSLLGDKGLKGIGAGIGAGLVVMGGAAGIGRIGGSAVESMARQPEAAGTINTAMLITAAMIEGATLFAVVVCLLGIM